jgi:hypothetical protein
MQHTRSSPPEPSGSIQQEPIVLETYVVAQAVRRRVGGDCQAAHKDRLMRTNPRSVPGRREHSHARQFVHEVCQ